jgi:two-component system, LytTR family, response regulator
VEKKIKAIIVDDEESARNVLSNLITRFCPQVEIVTTCSNVIEAIEAIKEHQPNVVFLDIEMPNYAGYEIVSFFEEINFEIIFVTAYDQYAIKAFEISAVDYLLKPVEIERLKNSVEKLTTKIELNHSHTNYKALTQNLESNELTKIVVRHNGEQQIISVNEIITIEANESYSCIHTIKGKYLASKNLKHFETIFSENNSFFRSHKSWMINLSHLVKFSKSKLEIELTANIIAKLSKYKKPEFEKLIIK